MLLRRTGELFVGPKGNIMKLINIIRCDYSVYQEHFDLIKVSKSRKLFELAFRSTFVVVLLFRATSSKMVIVRMLSVPLYKIARIISGIQIKRGTDIGPGLLIPHYGTIVINRRSKIGKKCIIMHNVTLAAKGRSDDMNVPIIGDAVYVGAGAILLGGVMVGNNSTIGAGTVITKDIKEGSVVVGNPARELKPNKVN